MESGQPKALTALPACPADHSTPWKHVEVVGLVAKTLVLDLKGLSKLPQAESIQDIQCYDGWVVRGLRWNGVPVAAVLELAGCAKEAAYVNFSCGGYLRTLAFAEATAPGALLALQLEGRPLPEEHGGPCRLLAAGKMGPACVKWIERIEVTNEAPKKR